MINAVYSFLLNMWIMNRIEEDYLDTMVTLKRITVEEKGMIMTTPRISK